MQRPSRALALATLTLFACHGDSGSDSPASGGDDTSSTSQAVTLPPLAVPPNTIVPDSAGVLAPAGGGSTAVDDRGQVHQHIPIWVPPGRAGIQPNLSLDYTSGTGNGLAGVGWGLAGLSRITRCPNLRQGGAVAPPVLWTESDTWCIDGEPLVGDSDHYIYRKFHDDGSFVVRMGTTAAPAESFKLFTRDGRISTFGATPDSRVVVSYALPAPTIMTYALSRVEDRAGNFMTVSYNPSGGDILPGRIDYTGSASDPTTRRSVTFAYEPRPDVDQRDFGNQAFTSPVRLWHIDMHAPNSANLDPLRSVTLAYDTSSATGRSVLSTIAECDGPPPTLPLSGSTPLCRQQSFLYSQGVPLTATNAWNISNVDSNNQPMSDVTLSGSSGVSPNVRLLDVNGDGKDDLLYLSNDASQYYHLRFSTGTTFGPAVNTGIPVSLPANISPTVATTSVPLVLDFDGDGHSDVLVNQGSQTNPVAHLYLANYVGGTWMLGGPGHEIQLFSANPYKTVQTADLNGDARPDLLMMDATGNYHYSLNTNGTFAGLGPVQPLPPQSNGHDAVITNYFLDLNNDAATDIMTHAEEADACVTYSTGEMRCDCKKMGYAALDVGTYLYAGYDNPPASNTAGVGGLDYCESQGIDGITQYTPIFGDFNGDGIVDVIETIVLPDPNGDPPVMSLKLKIGGGHQSFMTAAGGALTFTNPNVTFQVLDADLDGKADLLVRGFEPNDPNHPQGVNTPYRVYSWKSGAWQEIVVPVAEDPNTLTSGDSLFTTGDVNGDGLTDFIAYTGAGGFSVYERNGPRPDELTYTSGDFTPATTIAYQPYLTPADEDRSDCHLPLACVTRAGYLVHEVSTDNGNHGWRVQQHVYSSGRTDTLGWGFLGFKGHTTTDTATGAATTRLFQFGLASGPTLFYPFIGLPYEIDTTVNYQSGAQTVTRTTRTSQGYNTYGTGPFMALLSVVESVTTDSNVSTPIASTNTSYSYDNYGNRTSEAIWYPIEDEHRLTTTTYLNDYAHLIIGRPTYVSTTSLLSNGTLQTRETAYTYDAVGQLAVQIDNPGAANSGGSYDPLPAQDDGVQTLYTKYTRNGNGLPTLVEKLDNLTTPTQRRAVQTTYDASEGMFAIQTTDPKGLVSQTAYEPGLGVVAASTDAAGVLTTYQYDTFGRIRADHPAAGGDRVVAYHAAGPGNYGTIDDHRLGQYLTTTTLDSLRRTVSTATSGRDDGKTVYLETTYDDLGRTSTVSRPHFHGVTGAFTTTSYDQLNRVTRIAGADGGVISTTYLGNQVTTTNADGNVSLVTNDSLGRPVTSVQATTSGTGGLSGHVTTTTLAYGPFDTLQTSTDTAGNEIYHKYDRLGRELWKRERDSGVTAHRYNLFGEVSDETRGAYVLSVVFGGHVRFLVAGGTDTQMTYDDDGRVTTKTAPDVTQTYTYDTLVPGKLSSETITNGPTISFTYDSVGRVKTKKWDGPRGLIGYSYGYDQYNRVSTVTYPTMAGGRTSMTLLSSYSGGDIGGQQTAVTDITNPTSPKTYWKLVSTDASEAFPVANLRNGVTTTYGEDPLHAGWLKTISSTANTATIQNLHFTREGSGRVQKREDLVNGISETFGYDGLERLTSWSWNGSPGARGVQYVYDDLGNLTNRTITAGPGTSMTYTYGGTSFAPHQLASDGSATTFQYDSAGNQLVAPDKTLAWASFGKPTTVTTPAGTYTMTYDAELARFSRTTPSGQTRYSYGGLFDEYTDGTGTHYVMTVMAPGRPVAEVEKVRSSSGGISTTRNALLVDALGSIDTIVTSTGHQTVKYDPFGTRVTTFDPTTRVTTPPHHLRAGFTGHDHDDDINLIDMIGRIYDPAQQRFLSVDPPAPAPIDSQAYNPYAYVRNNPLNATDPTGYYEVILDGYSLGNDGQDAYAVPSEAIPVYQVTVWTGTFVIPYGDLPGEVQGPSGTDGTSTIPGTQVSDLGWQPGQCDPDAPREQEAQAEQEAAAAQDAIPGAPSDPVARAKWASPGGYGFNYTGISNYVCDNCEMRDEELAYASATANTPFGSVSVQLARTGDVFISVPLPGVTGSDSIKFFMKPQFKLGFSISAGFLPSGTSDDTLVHGFLSGGSVSGTVAMGLSETWVAAGKIVGHEYGLSSPGFGGQISWGFHLGGTYDWGLGRPSDWSAGFTRFYNALNSPSSEWLGGH